MRLLHVLVVSVLALAAACGEEPAGSRSAREPLAEETHLQRMVVLERPPVIAVLSREEMPLAIRAAETLEPDSVARRQTAARVGTDALPFLTQTETGRRFLAAAPPRAIARGMPAEFCPAVASASGAAGDGRGAVARRALEACLAQLGPEREGCGCRVLALDDVVTVPRDETAYATGVSARMQVPDMDLDLLLVAEDARGDARRNERGHVAGDTVLLRDLRGPVARLSHGEDDSVEVVFTRSGRRFEGYRVPVGFRRGRLAQRIYARDAEGHRLRLLVGFEPEELAGHAAAWLAWPDRG